MKRLLRCALLFLGLLILAESHPTPCFSQDTDIYMQRRQKIGDWMERGIAVLRKTEGSSSDFFYLTGFDEPDAALLLIPGREKKFIFFVRPRSLERSQWTGDGYGVEGARKIFGADKVYPLDQFESLLSHYLKDKEKIYCLFSDEDLASTLIQMIGEPWSRQPKILVDLTEHIHEMRLIKSPEEIVFIQKAADITCKALVEAMKAAEPGMNEREVEAVIEYTFLKEGAAGPGFPSIVGSGPNSTVLHYEKNNRETRAGDLMVLDIGAEFEHYKADVTRTIPVSGKFSKEQRDLYEIILKAQEAAVSMVAPGIRIDDIHRRAVEIIAEGLLRLGLITEINKSWQMEVWLMHKVSHWLGLDVHDAGDYRRNGNSSRLLEPGMVLTVEPGVYVREKSIEDLEKSLERPAPKEEIEEFVKKVKAAVRIYKNIGIRIEDDLLVTETGCLNLSHKAPKTIEEIEKTMEKKSSLIK